MGPMQLPPNPFPQSAYQVAYQRCLDLEAVASGLGDPNDGLPPLISARLLGHLLRLAPTVNGRGKVARDIQDTIDDEGLMKVAQFYANTFIHAFKRHRGTPASSEHPSRPSFEDEREFWMNLNEAKLDHRTAKRHALRRDGYQCAITGKYDVDHLRANVAEAARLPQGAVFGYTNAAHIIPEATNSNIGGENEDGAKHTQAGGGWAVLSMFGQFDIPSELEGNKIHRLENIITMNTTCHASFDDLCLWLKPVQNEPNKYATHTPFSFMRFDIPETVTFTTTTTGLPLPSPAYLAIHALCCEVTWLSGVGEYITDIQRRMDETQVLAHDGSTATLLSNVLSSLIVH